MKCFAVYVVTLFLILSFSSPGHTTETTKSNSIIDELKIGLLYHDVDGLWSGSKREHGADLNCEVVFSYSKHLFGGYLRPVIGVSLNSDGYTSKIYLDGVWQYDITDKIFAAIGLGITVHNGETDLVKRDMKALGSEWLFHIPIEVGYRASPQYTISIYFDHSSNGYIYEPNEGLDTLGFRIGYLF